MKCRKALSCLALLVLSFVLVGSLIAFAAQGQGTAQAVRSLERLKTLDIKTVICYHGGLFHGDVHPALVQVMSNNEK